MLRSLFALFPNENLNSECCAAFQEEKLVSFIQGWVTISIYCDVHAVVLFRGNKGGYLVTTIHRTMDVSLKFVPRKGLLYGPVSDYISRTMT
jgi:hypothetical protein